MNREGAKLAMPGELRKDSRIESILNSLENKVSNLETCCVRFETLADKFVGSQPQDPSKPFTNATPSAYLDRMDYCINRLDSIIDLLNQQHNRLND